MRPRKLDSYAAALGKLAGCCCPQSPLPNPAPPAVPTAQAAKILPPPKAAQQALPAAALPKIAFEEIDDMSMRCIGLLSGSFCKEAADGGSSKSATSRQISDQLSTEKGRRKFYDRVSPGTSSAIDKASKAIKEGDEYYRKLKRNGLIAAGIVGVPLIGYGAYKALSSD